MVRLRMYECKAVKSPKGYRSEYQAGLVYNVEDELAAEWMEGSPPSAWPEGEERPDVWPPLPDEEEDEEEETVEDSLDEIPVFEDSDFEL
jgi:hypothetical protein